MSNLRNFSPLPVRLPTWEELNRRVAEGFNYLKNWVDTLTDRVTVTEGRLDLIDRIYDEYLYAGNPTTFDGPTGRLIDWQTDAAPPDSTIAFDRATGIATITYSGYYDLNVFINWLGTGQNLWYGLDLIVDGTSQELIGGMVWTNAYTDPGATLVATFSGYLAANQTVAIGWNSFSQTADFAVNTLTGQMTIALRFPETAGAYTTQMKCPGAA